MATMRDYMMLIEREARDSVRTQPETLQHDGYNLKDYEEKLQYGGYVVADRISFKDGKSATVWTDPDQPKAKVIASYEVPGGEFSVHGSLRSVASDYERGTPVFKTRRVNAAIRNAKS